MQLETVQIGPCRYTVQFDRQAIERERLEQRDVDLVGTAGHRSLRIVVDPDLAPDARRETVLHEVLLQR